jgi:murein L,D-transpeptidase YafK
MIQRLGTRMRIGLVLIPVAFASSGVGCSHHSSNVSTEQADRILISKSAHTLELLKGQRILAVYSVALGRNPKGPKEHAGDHKTPEGEYIIDAKKTRSRFHLALHISYPNNADRERARRESVDPGGDVEIHGIQNGLGWVGRWHSEFDWTDGCIAVTDEEIEQIWSRVAVGTPVEINP